MNEKEFKKIITDETSNSSYKANLNNLLEKLVLNLKDNLNPKITLDNYSFASFEAFGIYTTDKVVNVCLDLNSPIDNKVLESTLFFNSLENALICPSWLLTIFLAIASPKPYLFESLFLDLSAL